MPLSTALVDNYFFKFWFFCQEQKLEFWLNWKFKFKIIVDIDYWIFEQLSSLNKLEKITLSKKSRENVSNEIDCFFIFLLLWSLMWKISSFGWSHSWQQKQKCKVIGESFFSSLAQAEYRKGFEHWSRLALHQVVHWQFVTRQLVPSLLGLNLTT